MKIAIFHDLPSGGAKRTVYETMKRMSQRHDLDVYTLDTADKSFCNLDEWTHTQRTFHFSPSKLFGSPLGRFNQVQRWRDLHHLNKLAREISAEIDSRKYDLVFAQPCMWTQAPLVLMYLKTPTIYYCHEPPRSLYEHLGRTHKKLRVWRNGLDSIDPFINLFRSTARQLDQNATRSAKLVLVNSNFIKVQVNQIYRIDPVVCYHGVDAEIFSPQPQIERKDYALAVGAILPHKGLDFLIECIASLPKDVRPALRLVGNSGSPDEQYFLQTLAARHDVDLSIEIGVSQETLVRRYNEAKLVIYTPHNEPFGLVSLEAMACGRPVVGVCEGGILETVIHNHTGLLIERDQAKFGAAIRELLENPSVAERYGRNGRQKVLDDWTWEKSVERLEQYMSDVVERFA